MVESSRNNIFIVSIHGAFGTWTGSLLPARKQTWKPNMEVDGRCFSFSRGVSYRFHVSHAKKNLLLSNIIILIMVYYNPHISGVVKSHQKITKTTRVIFIAHVTFPGCIQFRPSIVLGMAIPPLIGNPYDGYITPSIGLILSSPIWK